MIGGRQTPTLAKWATEGNAVHELMHALGFTHEHHRIDRDQYVECLSNDTVNYGINGIDMQK